MMVSYMKISEMAQPNSTANLSLVSFQYLRLKRSRGFGVIQTEITGRGCNVHMHGFCSRL
jgi:hypothetical protein